MWVEVGEGKYIRLEDIIAFEYEPPYDYNNDADTAEDGGLVTFYTNGGHSLSVNGMSIEEAKRLIGVSESTPEEV